MRYMGSKNRLSKEIIPIIQSYITADTNGYLEPFVGGANVIDKIACNKKYACDINEYLIELLIKSQKDVSDFPSYITEEDYYNENGEVATFNYNTVSALLVSGVKDLDIKVSAIDTRLAVVEQGTFSGNITVAGNLTVSGLTQLATLRVNGKIISGGTTPTATLTDNTGTVNITGNDTAGTISFTAGTNPASGSQATITFNTPYDIAPRVVLTAGNDVSVATRFYIEKFSDKFVVYFLDQPASMTNYQFDYHVIQ